ncbi:transmembrane protein 92-like [Apodemus sylvaticus]|uniref:transmembrane protein 92-like n=1 Tax=Apodemus sylvaticus TaxID=10129 RepID=UPI00224217BC|nr:transmembrane protein 92-like [Apodemus sylvaticus]XP_052053768.1 transmembrane protein 92-like [Apodemus sylvaticus]
MKVSCVVGTLTLIFGLLSTLQGVSTNEHVNTCDSLSCPKGFTCCDNECCPERNVWDPVNYPFRFMFIILLIMVALLCICGLLLECFCPNCRIEQHDIRTGDHQATTEPPFTAPLESICVSSLDRPPGYSQVVLNPTPTEPPPPYSLRPESPAGQMRGNAYATL